MGKTKIKTIDDSAQEEPKKKVQKDSEHSEKPESQKVSESENQKSDISDISETPISSGTPSSSEFSEKTESIKQKKIQKPGKAKPRSKKYQEAIKDLDRSKTYPIPEAVDMAKKVSYSKFDGTLEAHINTAQTGIRGLVSLPFASGKTEYEHGSKQVYKTEAKSPVIHLGLGKLNQPAEELSQNVKTLLQTIGKTRIKQVSLSPTMGPSVKLDLSSI